MPGSVHAHRFRHDFLRLVAPDLLWHSPDADGRRVLRFEHVDGRVADYRPGLADPPLVLDSLRAPGQETCPAGTDRRSRDGWMLGT